MRVSAPHPFHHRSQAQLIHRQLAQVGIIPGGDALGVEVHHRYVNMWAAIGDHNHGRSAHVAGADAADGWDGDWRGFHRFLVARAGGAEEKGVRPRRWPP